MSASSHTHYVPFLKGKAGEFKALKKLDFDQRQAMTPLFDVPPEGIDFKRDKSTGTKWIQIHTVDKALDGYAAKIAGAWKPVDRCYVDLAGFDPSYRLADGAHPVAKFFADAKDVNLTAVPVTGPERDAAQVAAVKKVCKTWRLGAAIRLRHPHLGDPVGISDSLTQLLGQIDQQPADVDLLLDFGQLIESNFPSAEAEALTLIAALPHLQKWRSLVLCSGAFPFNVSDFVKKNKTRALHRRDWQLWQSVVKSKEPPPRLPAFGDYGASCADWGSPFDPTEMSMSAKIIYATVKDWVIVKGEKLTSDSSTQYYGLARRLEKRKDFLGKDHCSSEQKIIDCAAPKGPGNAESWVTVATRHHVEVVSQQLASWA